MNVRDMGYRASFSVGSDLIEGLVLDYSATGMQVEVPAFVSIPNEGIVMFRDQAHKYKVIHEVVGEETKRLGLATSGIVELRRSTLPGHAANSRSQIESAAESHRFRRRLTQIAIWVVVSVSSSGLCAVYCGHGTHAKALYFRIFAQQVASASIEQANESARKMNELAKEIANNFEKTKDDLAGSAQRHLSSTRSTKGKRVTVIDTTNQFDNVSLEEN